MKPFLSARKSWHDVMQLEAPPERVFPLLCPALEYDWIEDWRCQMIYARSGVAEDGCIFRTQFEGDGQMTWIVNRYDAPWRIEFACFVPASHAMRLRLKLQSSGAGTSLDWVREFTATDPAGEQWIAAYTQERHDTMMVRLESQLRHYLDTGTMLRTHPAPAQPVHR
jgi:hypothetical protein